MWNDTRITQRLGIDYPIIQGPFGGGPSTPELTAAVSNAGGLGSYGAHNLSPDQIEDVARSIRHRTDRPFALNLWVDQPSIDETISSIVDETDYLRQMAPIFQESGLSIPRRSASEEHDFEAQVEAVLLSNPAVFSFVFGIPSPEILRACREREILTVGAATTVEEAVAIEKAGVDMIVATGLEAGGHRPAFLRPPDPSTLLGTFSLLPQICDAVNIPVIAAGGIADGRGLLAAQVLGAEAAQIGTAFLACIESGASELHRKALLGESVTPTILTRVYSGRLARYLLNSLIETAEAWPVTALPFPNQSGLMRPLKTAAVTQKNSELMSMAAGQSAPLISHSRASELIESIVQEVEQLTKPK
jgi:nitronate monooxygenase